MLIAYTTHLPLLYVSHMTHAAHFSALHVLIYVFSYSFLATRESFSSKHCQFPARKETLEQTALTYVNAGYIGNFKGKSDAYFWKMAINMSSSKVAIFLILGAFHGKHVRNPNQPIVFHISTIIKDNFYIALAMIIV